ncbi:MAG: hypothetical protein ACHP84_16775 [Caulobacterales bacterium]
MRNLIVCIAAAAALAGCATTADLDAGLSSLVGQPVKVAMDRLGPPTGQSEQDGEKVYFWASNQDVSFTTPAGTENTYGAAGAMPELTKQPETVSPPVNFRCEIMITVGGDEKIKSYHWSGNLDGCSSYAARLGK